MSELGRDYATSNTGGTRLIDVTMVGGDGRLIQ
jgi:hypothetical protein